MDIKLISEKRTIVVKIETDLDHHTAIQIRRAVDTKIKSSNAINVIFDFCGVEFMDSSGIGMLMGRYKIANILGGKVLVFGMKKQIKRIIDMSGIDKVIVVCESLEEALRRI